MSVRIFAYFMKLQAYNKLWKKVNCSCNKYPYVCDYRRPLYQVQSQSEYISYRARVKKEAGPYNQVKSSGFKRNKEDSRIQSFCF